MTWDLSKLYAGFDAPEFLNDVEELKRCADEAVAQARDRSNSATSNSTIVFFTIPFSPYLQ